MSVPTEPSPVALSRQARKDRTREAILDTALELTREQGFAGLSLRQVTRGAGIVPTAFYRHFASMEELGLALVDRAFATLRAMIRDARRDPRTYENVIEASTRILMRELDAHREHFAFIARERLSGVGVVREAIRHELRMFVSELAIDLGRLPQLAQWSSEDVQMASGLFVNNMVSIAEQVIELPDGSPDLEAEVERQAVRQLRLIVVGLTGWRSDA